MGSSAGAPWEAGGADAAAEDAGSAQGGLGSAAEERAGSAEGGVGLEGLASWQASDSEGLGHATAQGPEAEADVGREGSDVGWVAGAGSVGTGSAAPDAGSEETGTAAADAKWEGTESAAADAGSAGTVLAATDAN